MQADPIFNQQQACQAAEKGNDDFLKALSGAAGIIYANTLDIQREYYALSDQLAAVTLLEQALQPLVDTINLQGSDDVLRNTPITTDDKDYWLSNLATEVNALLQGANPPRRKVLDVNRLARETFVLPLQEENAFKEIETASRGSANIHWSLDADKMHTLYQEYFMNEVLAGYYEYIAGRMEKCTNLAMIRDMFHDVKVSQLLLGDTIQVVTRSFPVSTTISVVIKGKEYLLKLLERKRKELAEKVKEARQEYVDTTTAWYSRLWNGTPTIRSQKGVAEQYFEGVTHLPFPILDPLNLDEAELPAPIKALFTANVSIETCDAQGNTLAMLAARGGFSKVVRRLLSGGANPYSLNKEGLSLFQQIGTLYHSNVGLLKVGAEHQEMMQTQPLFPEVRHALIEQSGESKQMAIQILQTANRYLKVETDMPGQAPEAFFLRVNNSNAIQERSWATIFQGFFDKEGVKGQRMEQLQKIIRVCWQAILLEDDTVLTDTFKDILSSAVAGPLGRRNSRLLGPVHDAVQKLEKGQGRVMTVTGSELFRRNSMVGALVKVLTEREQELAASKLQLTSSQAQIVEKDAIIAKKDEQIENVSMLLQKKDVEITEIVKTDDLRLSEKDQEILRQQKENERLQAMLDEAKQQAKASSESADKAEMHARESLAALADSKTLSAQQAEQIGQMKKLIEMLAARMEGLEVKQQDQAFGGDLTAGASERKSPTQMRRS